MRLIALALAVVAIAAGQPSFTHYVAPDGSWSSACTESAPCSLWRAVQLANGGQIGVNPIVRGAAGYYSQGRLTLSGHGASFIFDQGATLTGTRVKPTSWEPVEGFPHVFSASFSETPTSPQPIAFAVGTVAQRSPSTWRPIRVDDHGPPPERLAFGRPFDLREPVKFKAVSSLAQVEAQSGTWLQSFAADRVYVHTYHDGPPTDADDLWIAPSDWGALVITGDNNTIEGLTGRNTSGTWLRVMTSASGTVLRRITAIDAQVWLEGVGTIAEDLDVSHAIKQGDPSHAECYDANPEFGVGECWNAHGEGRALLVGKEGTGYAYNQTIRRARVHRGWNGARVDGPNVLERAAFWGFPNHTLEPSGQGVVIRDSVFLNGQDSLFARGAFGGWLVERNIFHNAVYVTASNNGVGGSSAGPWSLRGNVLQALTLDRHAFVALSSDCNVWMETPGGNLFRVIDTNGIRGFTLRSLGEIRAMTGFESGSRAFPSSAWTAGRFFARFEGQASEAFDFGDPLKVCGQRAGPS
jgi:hypothetical protein